MQEEKDEDEKKDDCWKSLSAVFLCVGIVFVELFLQVYIQIITIVSY